MRSRSCEPKALDKVPLAVSSHGQDEDRNGLWQLQGVEAIIG